MFKMGIPTAHGTVEKSDDISPLLDIEGQDHARTFTAKT